MKTILVIGATGMIGKSVADQLKEEGNKVRVLSRNADKAKEIFSEEFEIFEGDVRQIETLHESMKGVNGVYINLPEANIAEGVANICTVAKEEGVEHIGYTSGCTVRKENAWHPMINAHFTAENLIMKSEIAWTIFRPTMVLDSLPNYANSGKPFLIGNQPHGWSWIFSKDMAKMVAKAFQTEAAKNKKFTIFGPDKVSIPEAIDRFNAEFFPQAKPVKAKPYWMAHILALFIGKKFKYVISLFKYFSTHPEEGDPSEANQLLGQPQTGLNEFFALYKAQNIK